MEWDNQQQVLDTLPDKPGCYLMKDEHDRIIYIGKAVNLRNRVRSYFHNPGQQDQKTRRLVRDIADIEWIVVASELEALILEMNLIKRHKPRYNVRLKDDKRYPYIKVHWQDPFPKVTVTRQMVDDGARYFGPYTSAWAVHQTLDLLRKIFPYLTCNREITGQDARACLYYDIKLCSAPCIGAIKQAEYRQVIDDLCQFLDGRTNPVIKTTEREHGSGFLKICNTEKLQPYESAAAIDRVRRTTESCQHRSTDQTSSPMASDGEACVQIFFTQRAAASQRVLRLEVRKKKLIRVWAELETILPQAALRFLKNSPSY